MKLNSLKLGHRLGVGFGLVLMLAAGIATTGYLRLEATQTAMNASDEQGRSAATAARWRDLTELNVNRGMAVIKSGVNPAVDAHFAPLMKSSTDEISALQKNLEARVDSEDLKALLAEVDKKRSAFIDLRVASF